MIIKKMFDFYLSKKFFMIMFIGVVIAITSSILLEIIIFNPINETANELVSNSEEIHQQLGEMKTINYLSPYKRTQTKGATTKLVLITADEKTRYEIKVQIEKDETGKWYLYSWELLDESNYK